MQTPNLHVVFVLRQKVCILSKDLQRDCLNWSCILQYMSQFHPLPGFTCMLNKKGNFVQTGYPLLFPVISMCRRCTSAETWITSSYRSGEGFIITSKVFVQRSDFKMSKNGTIKALFVCSVRHHFSSLEIQKALCIFISV